MIDGEDVQERWMRKCGAEETSPAFACGAGAFCTEYRDAPCGAPSVKEGWKVRIRFFGLRQHDERAEAKEK